MEGSDGSVGGLTFANISTLSKETYQGHQWEIIRLQVCCIVAVIIIQYHHNYHPPPWLSQEASSNVIDSGTAPELLCQFYANTTPPFPFMARPVRIV